MRDKHSKLRKISSTNNTWTPKVCRIIASLAFLVVCGYYFAYFWCLGSMFCGHVHSLDGLGLGSLRALKYPESCPNAVTNPLQMLTILYRLARREWSRFGVGP